MVDNTNNHLANERTFLAWIRTSISIIVFGFVVAKFGVALREFFLMQHQVVATGTDGSLEIGVGFMTIGIIFTVISSIRYQITMRRIEAQQFRPANTVAILLGVFAALFGAILIVYLIITAQALQFKLF